MHYVLLLLYSFAEAQIQHDLEEAKACIKGGNAQKAFELVASATRKAKRVECLLDAEMENSNDPQLRQDLQKAKENIVSSKRWIVLVQLYCTIVLPPCITVHV